MKPLVAGLLLALLGVGAASAPAPDASWYLLTDDQGAVLGNASEEITAGRAGREVVDRQEVLLTEQDSPIVHISARTARSEDASGRTVSIESMTRLRDSWTRIQARIGADRAEIVRQTPLDRRTAVVALPAGVRFDDGDGLLAAWDPVHAPRLEFQRFDLDAMSVERVVIEAVAPRASDPPGAITAVRRRYDGDELRAVARLTLDRDHRIIAVTQPMFGSSITIRAVDRDTALRPHAPYRMVARTMIKSPFRIGDPATRGHIRYRFGFQDGMSFAVPETGEKGVTVPSGPEAGSGAVVDICPDCGPGLPTDEAYLADALKPTAWMQSDHPKLRAIAEPVARLNVSDTRKMQLLLELARPYLVHIDFAGHYSALETLSRRSGDCTEAAVLLAALGRSAGIPTRVVNGVVYSRESYHGVANAFLPHSWTLAYVDGRWRSFDLALDLFDSTHIALTVGDGDARSVAAAGQLASLLEWKAMTEVRTGAFPGRVESSGRSGGAAKQED
jgi:hypothetical protein